MKNEQKKIFSDNLKRIVAKSNLPQREIAKRIGVSPQTFNTWIQGIAIPRMGKIQLLADFFNINKSDLIEKPNQEISEIDFEQKVHELMNDLRGDTALMYSGEPMDDITKELVHGAIEQAARIALARHYKGGSDDERNS